MHRLAALALLLPLLTLAVWADEEKNDKPKTVPAKKVTAKVPRAVRDEDAKPTAGQEAFDKLAEEMEAKLNAAEKPAARKGVIDTFTKKFLDHATTHAKDTSAVDALVLVLTNNAADKKKDGPRAQALARLEKDYLKSAAIAPHLRRLVALGEEGYELVKDVAREGIDKRTKALAFRSLINTRVRAVRTAEALAKNAKMKASYEKSMGKEKVALMIDNAPKFEQEIKAYRGVLSKGELKGILADVSVGAPAPATAAVNLKGEKVALADYKGKVVVLDFWATWCGPCKQMIPQSRELVGEMKDRPFALISVSVDEESKTVETFLKKTPMPWSHWWVGRKGKQLELWDVEGFPTIYVLDHKGVIRYTQVGFDKSDPIAKVVEKLVEEAEADKKAKTE